MSERVGRGGDEGEYCNGRLLLSLRLMWPIKGKRRWKEKNRERREIQIKSKWMRDLHTILLIG